MLLQGIFNKKGAMQDVDIIRGHFSTLAMCSPVGVGQFMVSMEKAAPKSVVQPVLGVNEGHSTQ